MTPALKTSRQGATGKPFVPGDPRRCACPPGRPRREYCIAERLREIGGEPEGKTKQTKLEAILRRVVDLALKGTPWAVQFIADRLEGKVTDVLSVRSGDTVTVVEEIITCRVTPKSEPLTS